MQDVLAEIFHSQPQTPVATDKTDTNIIISGTAKIISIEIDMIFYWLWDIIQQNNFHLFWKKERTNLEDNVTRHHPIWHHRTMLPKYLKPTTKVIENSKGWKTITGRGRAETSNPGVTRTPDNPLKRIRNPIPRKPDNILQGIHNLVPNIIRRHWPRGLTVPT